MNKEYWHHIGGGYWVDPADAKEKLVCIICPADTVIVEDEVIELGATIKRGENGDGRKVRRIFISSSEFPVVGEGDSAPTVYATEDVREFAK